MPHDKPHRGQPDAQYALLRDVKRDLQRIDLSQGYEVRYWCQSLCCTEPRLRWAVRQIGPVVGDIRRYLSGAQDLRN